MAQVRREEKERAVGAQIADLRDVERRLTSLHHEVFPTRTREVLPAVPPSSSAEAADLRRRLRQARRSGLSVFALSERRRATRDADEALPGELRRRWWAREISRQRDQLVADQAHTALVGHDPATVVEALDAAFADNAHDATCVDAGVADGRRYVTVVIIFGTPDMVPDQVPGTTPSGKPNLKRRTKTDRNALYGAALASCVLATVYEALAVAVAADDVNVVVLRPATVRTLEPIYMGQLHRGEVPRPVTPAALWESLATATGASLRTKGAAREVVALPDDEAAGLQAVVAPFEESFLAMSETAT